MKSKLYYSYRHNYEACSLLKVSLYQLFMNGLSILFTDDAYFLYTSLTVFSAILILAMSVTVSTNDYSIMITVIILLLLLLSV